MDRRKINLPILTRMMNKLKNKGASWQDRNFVSMCIKDPEESGSTLGIRGIELFYYLCRTFLIGEI